MFTRRVVNEFRSASGSLLTDAERKPFTKVLIRAPIIINPFFIFCKKTMTELLETLKQQVIDALNLEDLTPEDIDVDAPLFGEGLGLDSIDALELIMILEKEYGIKLQSPAQGKEIFKSIRTMAEFIQEHRTK